LRTTDERSRSAASKSSWWFSPSHRPIPAIAAARTRRFGSWRNRRKFDIVACADLRESFERDSPGATVAVGETLAIHRCEVSSSALQSRQLVACQLPSAARIVEDGALEPVERGWDVMFQRRRERETPNPFEAVNPCVERRERHHASELSRP
jgi:hypothetical protein